MASKRSARSMLTSSTIKSSSFLSMLRLAACILTCWRRVWGVFSSNAGASSPMYCSAGIKAPNGSWKRECRVTPSALMAAMPVGAATMVFLWVRRRMSWRNVVLPVPARPVRKTWQLVLLTYLEAAAAALSIHCGIIALLKACLYARKFKLHGHLAGGRINAHLFFAGCGSLKRFAKSHLVADQGGLF